MPTPPLSYGLNLPQQKPQPLSLKAKPAATASQKKRKKTIFDSDNDSDEGNGAGGDGGDGGNNAVEITTLDGPELTFDGDEGPSSSGGANAAAGGTGIGQQPATKRKPPPPSSLSSSFLPPGGKRDGLGKPLNKNSIFADEDDDDEHDESNENRDVAETRGMGLQTKPSKNDKNKLTGTSKDYTNLAALHSSRKHAQEAQDLDPSIYSYDAVYDSLHAAKKNKQNGSDSTTGPDGASVPRYMTNLLRSAEIRKRDQLRARERLLAKEREAEGDEFADKEKFVTAAYKAQQAELRRMEEEEARREKEEEERRRRNGGGSAGMVGFYRDMLAKGEERHEELVKATEEAARKANIAGGEEASAAAIEKEKTDAQIAAELNARGANIILNDEGQVVDKRQLLGAGLNVAPKPKTHHPPTTAGASAIAGRGGPAGRTGVFADTHPSSARAAQRVRQTEMIAKQLEERARQEEEAEAARQRDLAEKLRTRKTDKDVSSARERYLARKREREQAAAAAAKEKAEEGS